MTRLLELHCTHCEVFWDVGEPWQGQAIDARLLGDGAVCLVCPGCHRDLAVVAAPSQDGPKSARAETADKETQ